MRIRSPMGANRAMVNQMRPRRLQRVAGAFPRGVVKGVHAAFQSPDNMRVIEVATPQAKPGVRSIPLLERPADSAGVPFDRMIHRAKVPPSAMRFCCRARVVEEPSAPR